MSRKIAVGIDIGTYQVKVVITEESEGEARTLPKVIGVGFAESKGMRHGYIVNPADVSRALALAVAEAEKTAGVKVRRAYIAVGGIGLSGVTSSGSIIISRADLEITEDDLKNVLTVAEGDLPQAQSLNRKVLHAIPLQYRLDGKPVLGRPSHWQKTYPSVRKAYETACPRRRLAQTACWLAFLIAYHAGAVYLHRRAHHRPH
jgi:cell division protein FtsA